MLPRPRSLRAQLMLWLLPPVLLLLAVDGGISYMMALKYANTAYDRALFDTTLTLAGQIHAQDRQIRIELPPLAMRMLSIDQYDKIYFRVDDISERRQLIGSAAIPLALQQPAADGENFFRDSTIDGRPARISALRLDFGAHRLLVQTAETLIKRQLLARQILWGIMLPQLMLILLACGIVWLGIRIGLAPLYRLEVALAGRSASDLNPLDGGNMPAEAGGMIRALNDLLARTASMLSAQHRFVANAAHQLRTPFAGIKAQIELARRLDDPQQVRHSLLQLQRAADNGVRLAQQLLLLARVDPENAMPQITCRLDLNLLAAELVAQWVPAALKKGQDLGVQTDAKPAVVNGIPLLLQELLANLIDNALRYTPSGGEITVTVSQSDAAVMLQVEDNGKGIAPEEREQVLERFYRSPDNTEPGCGLGLAIVHEIAIRHGALVNIGAGRNGRGSIVAITFPGCSGATLQLGNPDPADHQ